MPNFNPAEEARREKILKRHKKSISPKSVKAAEEAAKKALEKKYPGMFVPQTRTAPNTSRKKGSK
jgi:hypothetical protein